MSGFSFRTGLRYFQKEAAPFSPCIDFWWRPDNSSYLVLTLVDGDNTGFTPDDFCLELARILLNADILLLEKHSNGCLRAVDVSGDLRTLETSSLRSLIGHNKAIIEFRSAHWRERLRIPYTSVLSVDTRGLDLLQVMSPTYP